MICIKGTNTYSFEIESSRIVVDTYLNPDIDDDKNRQLPFSDNIIKMLKMYFNGESVINHIWNNPIEISKSDLIAIDYHNVCLHMAKIANNNYFSAEFVEVLKNKSDLKLVPTHHGKYYLTVTLFVAILDFLDLFDLKNGYFLDGSFKRDYKRINTKLKHKKSETKYETHLRICNNKIINAKYNIENYKNNTQSEYIIGPRNPASFGPTSVEVELLYKFFESIYLCKKKHHFRNDLLYEYDSKYVCLIESVYLRLLARKQNKNKVGFVHFYKHFKNKKCECVGFHKLKSDSFEDEMDFIKTKPYTGCSNYCTNFYENKWECDDGSDYITAEPIDDDFVIYQDEYESDDCDEF